MKDTSRAPFGKIRQLFFPIYQDELRKFIPLSILFFCISFNYSSLRALKDILILKDIDASFIYNIKIFGVVFMVVLFNIAYSKISSVMGRDGRFNAVILYFIAFFLLFRFFLLPNLGALQIDDAPLWCEQWLPKSFWGIGQVIKYWPRVLLYVHAELWSTFVLTVLFWTFANEITTIKQSKRFYSFLMIGSNIGVMIAGGLLKYIFKGDLSLALVVVISLSLLSFVVYNLFAREIQKNPSLYQVETKRKKESHKLSFFQSIALLVRSPYLALIAVLMLCYNISISMFEIVWKDRVMHYASGDGSILASIYGNQLIYIGLTSILFVIFFSSAARKKGWRFSALVAPVMLLIGACVFFSFLFFGNFFTPLMQAFNLSSLAMAVVVGLFNVVLIKGAKYIFFDPTKESAYIPLDQKSKVQGKAAVDGIGSRLGKSIGSVLVTMVYVPYFGVGGEVSSVAYYIAGTLLIVLIIWIMAVVNLDSLFRKRVAEREAEANEAGENTAKA